MGNITKELISKVVAKKLEALNPQNFSKGHYSLNPVFMRT